MRIFTTILAATFLTAGAASAEGPVTKTVEDTFDNVAFAVENAIVGKGLVIDYVSHVGDMLERTKADVGGTKTIFTNAQIYLFCSAAVSRQVMEADPMNLEHCPYSIFVAETPDAPGKVIVGHREYTAPSMAPVTELLDAIVADAVGE